MDATGGIILIGLIILIWIYYVLKPEIYRDYRDYKKTPIPKEDKIIVPIYFMHVPDNVTFRYRQLWWEKTNFKSAASNGEEIELDSNTPVGVILKDISENKRQYILQI